MKKILTISLLCLICFLTVGCGSTSTGQLKEIESSEECRTGSFECIARIDRSQNAPNPINTIFFFKDINTNLIYIFVKDYNANATYGGFSIYYNAEGNPMTYDEWKEIYNVD